MHRFRTTGCVLLLVGAFLVAVGLFARWNSAVEVTVNNFGNGPLRSLVLHVTGAEVPLGDLAPGTAITARVIPTGESHLEIEFLASDGQPRRLDAGGYFEPGYRGTIEVSIRDEQIINRIESIRVR